MKIVIGNNIDNATKVQVLGKHWELRSSMDMLERRYIYDNDRDGFEIDELKIDQNGNVKFWVGRDIDGIEPFCYKHLSVEVIRMDRIAIEYQHKVKEMVSKEHDYSEIISRSIEIGIKNGTQIVYIQFERLEDGREYPGYERFMYDNGCVPAGYSSPNISAPSWNRSRNLEQLISVGSYFEAIYDYVPNLERAYKHLLKNISK